MILSLSGPWANPNDWPSYLKAWGPYLTNWIGHTGFAELVSVKFDFMGGLLRGVDVLEAARELLKLIPPVTVPVAGVPVPIPVGWFLAQLVGPAATQALAFEAAGAVEVGTGFPKGFVTAKSVGMGRVTGTLDLTGYGLGKGKDDILVIVGPEVLSTDVRPAEPNHPREKLTLDVHPGVPSGGKALHLPLMAKAEGKATLTLKGAGDQDKTLQILVTAKPKETLTPKGAIVLKPEEARTIKVPLFQQYATENTPIEVINSDPEVLSVSKTTDAIVVEADQSVELFSFVKVGMEETVAAGQDVAKKEDTEKKKKGAAKKEEKFGISLPTSADLADYFVGNKLDNYLLQKLLPIVPLLTEKDVRNTEKRHLKRYCRVVHSTLIRNWSSWRMMRRMACTIFL